MPIIVTVHGTYSTGPDTGDLWWQKNSPFYRQLLSKLKTENGNKTTIEPFVWDGKNSEMSRRKAGEGLAKQLARDTRPTVLIGHSHGGSVIDHALTTSVQKGLNLDHVEKVFMVGTPFLSFAPPKRLFNSLGTLGKSLLLACWLILIILIGSAIHSIFFSPFENSATTVLVQSSIPCFMALLGLYYFRRRRLPNSTALENLQAKTYKKFASRLKIATHEDDEAFLGLKATVDQTPNLFHADFFLPKLSFYSLFLPPFLLLYIAASNALTKGLYHTSQGVFTPLGVTYAALADNPDNNIFSNLSAIGYAIGRPFQPVLSGIYATGTAGEVATIFLAGLLCMLVLFFVSRVLIWTMSFFLNPIANRLARSLNIISSRQLHNTAWGNDTAGESCNAVSSTPAWLDGAAHAEKTHITIPKPIAEEIRARSNEKIACAIPKLRENLKRAANASLRQESSDKFWDAFAGDELVHNTYFAVEEFNDLIAQEIRQTKSFA